MKIRLTVVFFLVSAFLFFRCTPEDLNPSNPATPLVPSLKNIYTNDTNAPKKDINLEIAPPSSIFLQYIAATKLQQNINSIGMPQINQNSATNVWSNPEPDVYTGWIPGPVDLSHTAGRQVGWAYAGFTIPSSYDLRDHNKVTPVKNQGPCGACWAFGALASLESFLLPSETWDFSENHMTDSHGFLIGSCSGGDRYMSSAYLSRWSGPIDESEDPYDVGPPTSPNPVTVLKHIQEILYLPDRTGPTDNDNIKQAIMTYGAVASVMYYGSSKYNSATKAYYNNTQFIGNHLIAIVGWDDSYSLTNFLVNPPTDGAFLIKNSWGTSWGNAGYFWISYWDILIGTHNAVYNNAETTTNYATVYNYDPFGWIADVGFSGTKTAWSANIFTVSSDEYLRAVSFYTNDLNVAYEAYVYDNVTSDPITSSLLGNTTGIISTPGYHTISFSPSEIRLTQGRKFSVVIKLTNPDYSYPIAIEMPYSGYAATTANAGESYISSEGTTWDDLTSYYANSNVCLKAFTIPTCDDSNDCTIDSYVAGSCVNTAKTAGTVCRASAGPCDIEETCDGTSAPCPLDEFLPSTTVCRTSAGSCDLVENCTGSSANCPSDIFMAPGTVCRAAAFACDKVENCSGISPTCPSDAFMPSETICRASVGPCDQVETCTGLASQCPTDNFISSGTVCRQSAGPCDQEETCTGVSTNCPSDEYLSIGTICRAAIGDCDLAETCSGTSIDCPIDGFLPTGTACRAAAGDCDIQETCSGTSIDCPSDEYLSIGTICRTQAGDCDIAEACTGNTAQCPLDEFTPSGTICRASAGPCDVEETCQGISAQCPQNKFLSSSTICRPSIGDCDNEETCTGSSAQCPLDEFMSSGTICRESIGVCDQEETCTGASIDCPSDEYKTLGMTCRPPAGDCDQQETCTGLSIDCPSDEFLPSGTICREAAGDCDQQETCTGLSIDCSSDEYLPKSVICREAVKECDQQENCSGTSANCPANIFIENDTPCDNGEGKCSEGKCVSLSSDAGVNDSGSEQDGGIKTDQGEENSNGTAQNKSGGCSITSSSPLNVSLAFAILLVFALRRKRSDLF